MEPRQAVAALANDRPEWIPVLEAAVAVSDRIEEHGEDFAGAWVLDELERSRERPVWIPNLRLLVTYGLLEKSGESTRGGKRAWYRFTAKAAVKEALSRLKREPAPPGNPERAVRRLQFVASGDSRQPGSDAFERAGDMEFEPPSWR